MLFPADKGDLMSIIDDIVPTPLDPMGVPALAAQRDAKGASFNVFAMWEELVARSPLALALVFGDGHVVYSINTAFEHTSKAQSQLVLQREFHHGFPHAAQAGVGTLLDQVLRTCEPETVVIDEPDRLSGEQRHLRYTVWPIIDGQARCDGLILHLEDMTEQMSARVHADELAANLRMVNEQLLLAGLREQELAETAHQRSLHDSLTGLANRSLLLDRLDQLFLSIKRVPKQYTLFLLDIDRFKAINDTLGHPVGDQVLMQVARRLLVSVRPEDTVARIGGDEFAILLVESNAPNEVMHIADRIQENLGKPFTIGGHVVKTSASIGIVHSSPVYKQAQEMLRDADIALYRSKTLGKAQSVVFDDTMRVHAIGQLRLEGELRYAITHEELRLHYQPIISLSTGAFIGVEALIRWQHPQRGLLQPQDFLPVAEETGLIVPLGEWVLRKACLQARAWQLAYTQPLFIAVNLSARHLKQHNLSDLVSTILRQIDFAPELLHLELTEGTIMEDVETNIVLLNHLTSLGVRLAVDDFGTGYSSLSYLKRLPFSMVKIDRSFIQDIIDDPNDAVIVAAIIAMAHRLGLQVIAEGVETEEQLAYVRAEHCDAVQGFLLGRPQSAAEITERLGQKNWLPSNAA